MDRKKELKKRIAVNALKNKIKVNLPSFDLIKIYDDNDTDFAYYAEKIKENWHLFNESKLDERLCPIGNSDEHYCEWILSEVPNISDSDEWLVTSSGDYGYWAKIKSGSRIDAIKELWSKDKEIGGQKLGYSKGFFAVNINGGMIIRVGCFLGGNNVNYNSENYYTLTIQKI
ncbi:MAG: hypothetical protein FWD01_04745 [Defluviitaleaceae bacterium]|nr:hypothetical protein [Defluviitaleaceae bacterium]